MSDPSFLGCIESEFQSPPIAVGPIGLTPAQELAMDQAGDYVKDMVFGIGDLQVAIEGIEPLIEEASGAVGRLFWKVVDLLEERNQKESDKLARQILCRQLRAIISADQDERYGERNDLIFAALAWARQLGYVAGVRIDPLQPEWPVVFIELPQGQISWHVPQHPVPWNGHTTEEKNERIRVFCREETP